LEPTILKEIYAQNNQKKEAEELLAEATELKKILSSVIKKFEFQ
jgi:hypothetical protein